MAGGYDTTPFDFGRLRRYAGKVAAECRSTPTQERTRKTTTSVPEIVTRRAGFLGLRTETTTVSRTVQQTERVIGPHWVLHRTNHHIESEDRGRSVEYHEQNYWALQCDGALSTIWEWEEFTRWSDGTTKFEQDCVVTSMTEEKVLRLDHLDKHYEHGGRGDKSHIWGTREPGKLIRHAKGVGLSLALKQLLNT